MSEVTLILVFFVLIGTVPIAVTVYMIKEWTEKKRKIRNAFAGREPLTEQEFYRQYFLSHEIPAGLVKKVRHILEQETGVDMSRLSAQDDFSGNLDFLFPSDDGFDSIEIIMRIEKEFNIKISDSEAAEIITVEDLILMTWKKTRPHDA